MSNAQRALEKDDMLKWCVDTISDSPSKRMTTNNLYVELIEDSPLNLTPDIWNPNAIGHLLTYDGTEYVARIKGNSKNGESDFYCLLKDKKKFESCGGIAVCPENISQDKNGIQPIVERAVEYLKKKKKAYLSEMAKDIYLIEITPQTLRKKLLARKDIKYVRIEGSSRAFFEYIG